ncbi:MAG: thiamine pyrophosphate-dependent enzyme, partial [Planctomycetota bacterium]|nr:thiamine pyrophosphate-dependent enzyme [Planctomycetota bacterium]
QPAASMLAGDDPLTDRARVTVAEARRMFEDMLRSRLIDVAARELKKRNQSYYTISSAGHELNVVLGTLLRPTDPCFLHYRSGAFMMARARHDPQSDPVYDTLLGICASSDDPVSNGRHKVWGSRSTWVPPQTSTIASHLPKAVGTALALNRARRMKIGTGLPADAIVCCSFGDASLNHATALAGMNAARYTRKRGAPMPILFLCEDNGIGISVATPRDWVRETWSPASHLSYFEATGEIDRVHAVAATAIETCRNLRAPVFLHLKTVRLWGHAGSDIETGYHSLEQIEKVEARDPLLATARRLVECGAAEPSALLDLIHRERERVRAAAERAAGRPKLTSRAEVIRPLAPWNESAARAAAAMPPDPAERARVFGDNLPERAATPQRRTMAAQINAALHDEMIRRPEMMVFGEDVGRKGGVYGVTQGLQARFGVARCFDTLLDETSILGNAQGAAHVGLLPVPEIQYLAYLHNAIDQLRGEACSLSFFSNGQFANPMVVRIQGLAYQKGFGGHFHNDNSVGALRDIPGLIVAVPSRGDDAARMLRGCLAAAKACQRVAVFLEPIALYHERDLFEAGDGAWLSDYPAPQGIDADAILPGEVGVHREQSGDLLIVTYGNGVRMSLRAARTLEAEHKLRARVLDLRWLSPLPHEQIARHAEECGAVLVADECRATGGGIADEVIARLAESGFRGRLGSVRAADCYIPLGPAADLVLMMEADVVHGARALQD